MRNSNSKYLLDSNILIYLVHFQSSFHAPCRRCVEVLEREGADLVYTPQNAAEFWAISTRPVVHGGLGFSSGLTSTHLAAFRSRFRVLAESPELFVAWQEIANRIGSIGRHVHDARLAGAMRIHQIDTIITKNVKDFRRFPFLEVVDPEEVVAVKR